MPTNCKLLKYKVLLSDNVFPDSYEYAKKMLKRLGVEYISYHACLIDYIIYRGEYMDKVICIQCRHNYKSKNKGKAHGPPNKILKHMIIPRIQRLDFFVRS